MNPRFDRLSKRQRESLRGVGALKGSKEIADELGIEKSTVDGYIAEAVRVLGARDRRDAARQFEAYETALSAPDKIGGDSARLAEPAPLAPMPVSPDGHSFGRGQPGEAVPEQRTTRFRLPFRQKGQVGNDLTVGERLIWIQVIVVGLSVGFGMLSVGLQVLAGVIASVAHLFR